MCDFCNGEKIKLGKVTLTRFPHSPRLIKAIEGNKESLFEINFCPFCGKSYMSTNPNVVERMRQSDGIPIRGYLIGSPPFEYIIEEEAYEKAPRTNMGFGDNELLNIKMVRVLNR